MKKILSMVLAGAMCFSLAACGENEDAKKDLEKKAAEAQQQKVAEDDAKWVIGITEYEPMNYKDDNDEWTGFDTEFALAVAEKLDKEVEFKVIEWDSKILELNSGAIDCVWNGMTLTEEVENGMSCSKPYVENAQVLVMSKDKIDSVKEVSDLAGLKLVAEAGSAGEKAIIDAGFECTGVTAQSDALLEVSSAAADGCVIDITMANAMTGEGTSYANLTKGISLTSEVYVIGFKKDSDMVEKVNAVIDELKADGTLEALAEKYNVALAE